MAVNYDSHHHLQQPAIRKSDLNNGNANEIIPGAGQRGIFKMDTRWMDDYEHASPGHSILVANAGAHFHNIALFQEMLNKFVGFLKERNDTAQRKNNNIVFFRATSPGHKDCMNPRAASPLQTFEEFDRDFQTDKYYWNLFPKFNDYAREHSLGRQYYHFLNIYNMTALRPDGHVNSGDCLHYQLPSVIDWWNHLFFSSLIDIAESKGAH